MNVCIANRHFLTHVGQALLTNNLCFIVNYCHIVIGCVAHLASARGVILSSTLFLEIIPTLLDIVLRPKIDEWP